MLDANLSGLSLLDLRTLAPQSAAVVDAARTMRTQDLALSIDVRKSFDMLVHVPRISLWTSVHNAEMPDERAAKASA